GLCLELAGGRRDVHAGRDRRERGRRDDVDRHGGGDGYGRLAAVLVGRVGLRRRALAGALAGLVAVGLRRVAEVELLVRLLRDVLVRGVLRAGAAALALSTRRRGGRAARVRRGAEGAEADWVVRRDVSLNERVD